MSALTEVNRFTRGGTMLGLRWFVVVRVSRPEPYPTEHRGQDDACGNEENPNNPQVKRPSTRGCPWPGLSFVRESAEQDEVAGLVASHHVAMVDDTTGSKIYEIRVRGELSDTMIEALGASRPSKSATTIVVRVEDKAALHSAISRIEDLALELISVTPVSSVGTHDDDAGP